MKKIIATLVFATMAAAAHAEGVSASYPTPGLDGVQVVAQAPVAKDNSGMGGATNLVQSGKKEHRTSIGDLTPEQVELYKGSE